MIASIGFVILITVFFLIILGISLIIDKVGSYLQNKNLIFKIIVILLVGAGILLVALLTAILIMTITYINKEQIIILHAQKVSSVILGLCYLQYHQYFLESLIGVKISKIWS